MSFNTTILFVEDSDLDFELMLRALKQAEFNFTPFRATTIAEFKTLIDEVKPNIVISDYHLVGFTGFQVIEAFNKVNKDIPLIVVSSNIGEEKAVEALKIGATDYMLKSHIKKLPHVITRALEEWKVRIQREQTLNALRRREEMYSQLLNAMQDGLVQLSPIGEITYANPAFISMLGYNSMEEIAAINIADLYTNNKQDFTNNMIELKHKNGNTIFCETSIGELIDSNNSSALVVKNITNEIEQKKLSERLNAELDLLIYRIAHDLRGPICSLEGLIAMTKEKLDSEWNDMATMQLQQSYTILDKLTTLVQVRKHQVKTSTVILSQVFESLSKTYTSVNIKYPATTIALKTDKALLTQAIEPIIENAAKYKQEHQLSELNITVANAKKHININLTDNGIGIAPDKLANVFKMFYKGNNTAGLGLGLYLSSLIIEKLGGSIAITSELGNFTTVSIQLPK
jgi:PAS domain S-box-containing protein